MVHLRRMCAALVVALVAAGLAACGGSGSTSGNKGNTGGTGAGPGAGKKGGTVTVLSAGDVDYIDPGQTYYVFGFMINSADNRGLYQYKPGDLQAPSPDIASGPPQISADKKTVTVHMKSGIRFSPPVNREVTSKDIKYAFERAFTANVPSSYATVYFGDIAGAPKTPGKLVDIPGIETPDAHTVVFKLSQPSGVLVSQALALPISVPVPEEYAKKFDANSPSTYDQHVVFTGRLT